MTSSSELIAAQLAQAAIQTENWQSISTALITQKADVTYTNAQLALKANQVDLNAANAVITTKASTTYVDAKFASVGDGSPKGLYATLLALQTAFPTGAVGVYLVAADGKWYYWSGSAWTAGGTYQSTGIPDGTIAKTKLTPDLRYSFDDLSVIGDEVLTKAFSSTTTQYANGTVLTPFFSMFDSITFASNALTVARKGTTTSVGGGLFPSNVASISFSGLSASTYIVVAFDGTYVYHFNIQSGTLTVRKHITTGKIADVYTAAVSAYASYTSSTVVEVRLTSTAIELYKDGILAHTIPNNSTTVELFTAPRVLGFLDTSSSPTNLANMTNIAVRPFLVTSKVSTMSTDILNVKTDLSSLKTDVIGLSSIALSSSNISANNSAYSIDSGGWVVAGTVGSGTYKWVTFTTPSGYDTLTFTEGNITNDAWVLVKANATNVIGISVASSAGIGYARNFTVGGRTDILAPIAGLAKAEVGDVVRVVRAAEVYTFSIKRSGAADFTLWFTVDLTGLVSDATIVPQFGFLNAVAATGRMVYAMTISSSASSAETLQGKYDTLKSSYDALKLDYDTFKASGGGGSGGIPANEVDLVMFMGQSNMAGRGTAAQAPVVPITAGYEFRAISDPTKLYQIVEPFGVNENNASGITEPGMKTGSMVSSFVNAYYALVGRKIVGVSASKGGSSITQWQPGGAFLNDSIARFNAAKTWLTSNGYTIKNKFMVWCQGETDGDNAMSGATYTTNIKAMIDAMIAAGLDRCYIVRIGNQRDNPTLYDPIMAAQVDLCKTYATATMVSTKFAGFAAAGLMKDQFHYVQSAYNTVGEEAGTNVAFHINNKKEPSMYDIENNNLYFSYK